MSVAISRERSETATPTWLRLSREIARSFAARFVCCSLCSLAPPPAKASGSHLIIREVLIMRESVSGRSWTSKVFNTVITLDTYQFFIHMTNCQYWQNWMKSNIYEIKFGWIHILAQQSTMIWLWIMDNGYLDKTKNQRSGQWLAFWAGL